jgi:lysophospholipase L1-like esterase
VDHLEGGCVHRRRGAFLRAAAAALAAVVGSSCASATTSSAVPCAADPHLARTAAVVATSPSAVRIALVGDSTRNVHLAPTAALVRELRRRLRPGAVAAFGISGMTLHRYLHDPELPARVRAFRPTLVEISIGVNDLRVDQAAGPRLAADLVALASDLHAAVPGADLLLSVPAALATHDVGGHHYVVGPPGAAQRATTALRTAYLRAARTVGYAGLADVQRTVTGTRADPADPPRFLVDQLHPSARTAVRIADTITGRITGSCPRA